MKKLTLAAVILSGLVSTSAMATPSNVGNVNIIATAEKSFSCNVSEGANHNIELGYQGHQGTTATLTVETNGDHNSEVIFTPTTLETQINSQRNDDAVIWALKVNTGSPSGSSYSKLSLNTDVKIHPDTNSGVASLDLTPTVADGIQFKTAQSRTIITIQCKE